MKTQVFTNKGEVEPNFGKLLDQLGTRISFLKITDSKGQTLTLGCKTSRSGMVGLYLLLRLPDGRQRCTSRLSDEKRIAQLLTDFHAGNELEKELRWLAVDDFPFDVETPDPSPVPKPVKTKRPRIQPAQKFDPPADVSDYITCPGCRIPIHRDVLSCCFCQTLIAAKPAPSDEHIFGKIISAKVKGIINGIFLAFICTIALLAALEALDFIFLRPERNRVAAELKRAEELARAQAKAREEEGERTDKLRRQAEMERAQRLRASEEIRSFGSGTRTYEPAGPGPLEREWRERKTRRLLDESGLGMTEEQKEKFIRTLK